MLQSYYIGDVIGARSVSLVTIQYLFDGARKTEDGWEIQMLVLFGQALERCAYQVKEGGSLRFGKPFSLMVNKDGREDKKKAVKASELRISSIEADCLTVEYYEE